MSLNFLSGPLKDIQNHMKKELLKNINPSQSYGYQGVQDPGGVEGDNELHAGDPGDWDF